MGTLYSRRAIFAQFSIFRRAEHRSVIHQFMHFQVGGKLICMIPTSESMSQFSILLNDNLEQTECSPVVENVLWMVQIVSESASQWEMDCEECVRPGYPNSRKVNKPFFLYFCFCISVFVSLYLYLCIFIRRQV